MLASPWTVLERQTAHCFELATLLVSVLIGAGYDAYVVSGSATREVCNNDQLRVACPDLIPTVEVNNNNNNNNNNNTRGRGGGASRRNTGTLSY